MHDRDMSGRPTAPWQGGISHLLPEAGLTSSVTPSVETSKELPREQSLAEMAADLKNLIIDNRSRRS